MLLGLFADSNLIKLAKKIKRMVYCHHGQAPGFILNSMGKILCLEGGAPSLVVSKNSERTYTGIAQISSVSRGTAFLLGFVGRGRVLLKVAPLDATATPRLWPWL